LDNSTKVQPMPTPGEQVVLHHVINDLNARAEMGLHKYNTLLMTNNGRDALQDLLEELLDAVMYLKQFMLERENQK
jgi:hypothetical protein